MEIGVKNKIFTKTSTSDAHLYSNQDLRKLLVPIIVEQLLSSLMDNRLNSAMKFLASITIVMAIPTIISGIYGMNVSGIGMPLASSPYGFGIICVLILLICVAALWILKRKKML